MTVSGGGADSSGETKDKGKMGDFRQRIPVLNDIVDHGADKPCGDRVPDSKTFDALVESLQRDFMDRVSRSLQEVMAREEAGLRTAIRAHLEVMLPEIMEQWQQECREAQQAAERQAQEKQPFGRNYPGALEPMVAAPPLSEEHRRSGRRRKASRNKHPIKTR